MKLFLLLLAIFAVTFAQNYEDEFVNFMQIYGKTYSEEEFQMRFEVFKDNYDFIQGHNSESSFTVAMNEFGDMTVDEFAAVYNGFKVNVVPEDVKVVVDTKQNPTSVDWRTKGAVTGIKNQGQCGSCWSFSTTGSTEGCHFIAGNTLVGLSEQNLMDCSWSYGNEGCNGGLMDWAFEYIISNMGIDTESSYPYTAESSHTCKYSSSNKGASIGKYTDVPQGSETSLETASVGQPISVGIDASHSSFQFYSGGVYYEPACSSTQLDHGVLVVGYGVYEGSNYWLVKNSWGTSWGLSGYIMMSKDRNNNCGIATAASYPGQCS